MYINKDLVGRFSALSSTGSALLWKNLSFCAIVYRLEQLYINFRVMAQATGLVTVPFLSVRMSQVIDSLLI